MPRVVLLLDTTGPGGAETVFVDLATRLDAYGFDAVPVVQGPGWVADRLRSLGRDPVLLPSDRRLDLPYLAGLVRLIKRTRAAVVHAHLASTALYGGLAARFCGVPAVSTFHGIPDLGSGTRADSVRYALIRGCNERIVHVSASLRDEAVRRGVVRPGDTAVIYNGVSPETFGSGGPSDLRARLSIGPDAMLVGALGNIRPLKDYPTLVEAAALAVRKERRPMHFLVAGQGSDGARHALLSQARSLGIADRVHLLGFVEDVPGYLAALDVFLLTSTSEGFSIATIQAMAAEKPVVVTRSGGPEEIVTDGRDGILVPTRAPADAAQALARYQADPAWAREVGRAAAKTVRERFSIDAMIGSYADLYRSLGLASAGTGKAA